MPEYRRAADEIKAMISVGRLGDGITVPEIEQLTGTTYSTARRVAKELEAEGILQAHQGKGYAIVAAPEDAAKKPGEAEMRAQVAALQQEVAELRQRAARIENDLAALYGQTGHRYPSRGSNDRAKAAAGGGRQ